MTDSWRLPDQMVFQQMKTHRNRAWLRQGRSGAGAERGPRQPPTESALFSTVLELLPQDCRNALGCLPSICKWVPQSVLYMWGRTQESKPQSIALEPRAEWSAIRGGESSGETVTEVGFRQPRLQTSTQEKREKSQRRRGKGVAVLRTVMVQISGAGSQV